MATKQDQIEFVKHIYPAAKKLYNDGGISPLFVTAQAALETGYKIKGIGNNIFGITKGAHWTGPVSLELTTEYFSTSQVKFKEPERVVSIEHVGYHKYKYQVYRLFRNFASIEECLDSHMELLRKPMYRDAWPFRGNPKEFAKRLVDDTGAKYATAPNYASVLSSVIDNIARIVNENGL